MELINGEQNKKQGKGKKIVGISIIVLIIILALLISAILAIMKMDNERIKLNVDGKRYNIPTNLIITGEDGNSYIAISKLASYVGYEFYNGEYKEYTENKTKGYVECKDEVASFSEGSNIVYKNNAEDKLNFDIYKLKHPIVTYDDMLYANIDDVGLLFNSKVFVRNSDNTLLVQTMPYLINYYKTQITKYGYDGLAEDFITQKSIIYDLLVVKKEESYGVVSIKDFSRVIGVRYDKIKFIESTNEFVVTSDGKTGLVSNTGETKIDLRYDDIGLIDSPNSLYYAKNNELMGVLNGNGKVIVYMEYSSLGIDREQFPYDGIKNNMFLYGNCIPIVKGEKIQTTNEKGEIVINTIYKWGLADKLGNIILPAEYDSLGYTETKANDRSINNVIIIPSVNGIVIGKDGKYGVINSLGRMIIPCEFDKIYSITNEGKDEFYIEQDGKTMRFERYITDNKIVVVTQQEQEIYNQNDTTNTLPNNNNTNTNTTNTNSIDNSLNNNSTKNTVPATNNVITTVVR